MNQTVVGIDFGSGPDVTVLSSTRPHFLARGDKVRLDEPNRYRRYVAQVLTATAVELGVRVRPSKGFRRHIRRQKSLA